MTTDTSVCLFSSTDAGSPGTHAGTIARIEEILDACLVNGYGSQSPTSVVEDSGLVTATFSGSHGFDEHCVVLVAGADQAAFNGRRRVSVVNSTTIEWQTDSESGTATGSITIKRAPLPSWEKAYTSGTSIVYKSTDPGANTAYLRIYEKYSNVAAWRAYAEMTNATTGSGATPERYIWITSGWNWQILGDGRALYHVCGNHLAFFGDLVAFNDSDIYATFSAGRKGTSTGSVAPYAPWLSTENADGHCLKSLDGLTDAPTMTFLMPVYGDPGSDGIGADGVTPYSYAGVFVTGGQPVMLETATGLPRGYLPGMQMPVHRLNNGLSNGSRVIAADGRHYKAWTINAGPSGSGVVGWAWFDISGPWR